MLAMDDADEVGKLVGTDCLEVVVFVDVVLEIIEERCALRNDKFPVALPYADNLCRAVAHFPIKEVVLALLARLAEHRWTE